MPSRRDFIRLAATATGAALLPHALPASIARALAIPANRATGTIKDVEHVVILMQENRSFDHYFGSMRGVRGFADPRPARLPSGRPVWYQPTAAVKTHHYQDRGLHPEAEHVLPFYLNPKRTSEFQAGTDHGWSSGHLAWNHGHHDQWVLQKQDVLTMGYLQREDVAFHYSLADAFTLCDAYHCSVHANTAPNRIYLWSGTMDAANRLGTKANGPGFGEREKTNGYTWTTYPERLEKAGVSWKLYQGGTGIPGDPTDNYTDNSLEFFSRFQVAEGADPHGPLVQKGATDRSLAGFREDCVSGRLAQVTWVVAPYKYSEHPEASPRDGAFYVNAVLESLTANPEVWAKTVFLINYDENDGLFDHVVPPMPPLTRRPNTDGLISESLAEAMQDEFIDMDNHPEERRPLVPGTDPGGLQPIGLGVRVPMLVISPWSTGGYVCSQTFDHTSVLQFLETRFGVAEPNVNQWRRAICGDLTSAFDFAGSGRASVATIPVPAVLTSEKKAYSVPEPQTMPAQEAGTRPARPLPYAMTANSRIDLAKARLWLDLRNEGRAGAAFSVRNNLLPLEAPRRYSLAAAAGEAAVLADFWLISSNDSGRRPVANPTPDYDLTLHGPNGFFNHYRGNVAYPPSPDPDDNKGYKAQASPEAAIRYDHQSGDVYLTLTNTGQAAANLKVTNAYAAGEAAHQFTLAPGASVEDHWLSAATHNWFDLSVVSEQQPTYLRRFAGHVETGKASTSDPAKYLEEA